MGECCWLCPFHQFERQHDQMARAGINSNDLYKNNKKKYMTIQKKAIAYVKSHFFIFLITNFNRYIILYTTNRYHYIVILDRSHKLR
jgi:hypothetical protein